MLASKVGHRMFNWPAAPPFIGYCEPLIGAGQRCLTFAGVVQRLATLSNVLNRWVTLETVRLRLKQLGNVGRAGPLAVG